MDSLVGSISTADFLELLSFLHGHGRKTCFNLPLVKNMRTWTIPAD